MRLTTMLAWRNLVAHPLRSSMTTLAITLGVAMVLAASIVGQAVNAQVTTLQATGPRPDLALFQRQGKLFETAVLTPIRAHPDVAWVAPSLDLTATLQLETPTVLTLRGVDADSYAAIFQPELAGGAFLDRPGRIVLPVSTALAHNLALGDTVRLSRGGQDVKLIVNGRLAIENSLPTEQPVAFITLETAQQLLNAPRQIGHTDLSLRPGANVTAVQHALAATLNPDLALTPVSQTGGNNFNVLILQGALAIVGIIILTAAAFVIMNAFAMAVTARQQEIGALRALGMNRRQIRRQLLAEAGMLGAGGVLLGIPGGLGLAWLVMTLRQALGDEGIVAPAWGMGLSVGLGLLTTLLGALHPARRASRISPLAAMRNPAPNADAQMPWLLRYGGRLGGGLLLLLTGSITVAALIGQPDFIAATGLFGIAIAGLLLATLLLLPALLTRSVRRLRPFLLRRWGVAGRLAADNLQRQQARTALTAAALTIGFITIIGANTIITASLKGGLEGYFTLFNEEAAIIPDIPALMATGELSIENSLQVITTHAPLDPDLVTAVANLDHIRPVRYGFAPIPSELSTLPGAPGVFIDPDVFLPMGNFDFFTGDAASALAIMEAQPAVLMMPITAARLNVTVGDTVPVQTARGEVVFTVAGIGGTSTNFTVFNFADGEAFFGLETPSWLGIDVLDSANEAEALAAVAELVTVEVAITLFNMQDEGVGGMMALVSEIQALLNALLLLAVIVAALGVVNTMVINISERRREIGLLRAVGATQRQVRQAVMVEAAVLGFIAALVAAGFALVELGFFALIYTPNATESVGMRANWRTAEIAIYPALRDGGIAALFSLLLGPLVAALAARLPAQQAAAMNVIEATRSQRVTLRRTGPQQKRPSRRRRRIHQSLGVTLAVRNISQNPVRTGLSALAVSLGVAMTLAADFVSTALLATLTNSGDGKMQITHGFIVEQFDQMIGLVGFVLMGAAAFLVFNAFAMSVSQRRQQIGALRSLGMVRAQIMQLVLLEALLVGGAGTLIGLVLGPLLGQSVVIVMQELGGQFLEFGSGNISIGALLWAGALGLGISVASVLLPARRAARIPPLAAMRPQMADVADEQAAARARRRAAVGLLLIGLLFGYLAIAPPGAWIDTPWSEALTIALVLVWLFSLGLLLPFMIRLAGQAARRWRRGSAAANGRSPVTARLIGDNLQRSQGRVMLTILTLAVGLGAITGLTGFMTYAFNDLMGASIRRIAQENTWAVFPFDLESGIAGLAELDDIELPAAAITAVHTAAGDRATIVPVRFAIVPELSFFGDAYFTYVANPETVRDNPNFFQFNEGDWETALPLMQSGCGALVSPLIANRQQVAIGDTLTITGPDGPMPCTIAGIGAGYVNASIVGDVVGDALDATQPIGLSITPVSGMDIAALEADLQQAIASFAGVTLTPMTDFAATTEDALALFTVALSGMLLLAVVAAALGVINTTVMSVYERRQELGLLRAVGATRRQITQVVMGESALIGLLGALVGVLAGMGSVVIIVTVLGGRGWGVPDLDLWPAAGRALRPTLSNGVVGILAAPLICAWVARWPIRTLLRGTAVDTLNPERPYRTTDRQSRPTPARHLATLAWRNLQEYWLRAIFSAFAVALGVAMIVAAQVTSSGILDTLDDGAGLLTFFIETMDIIFLIIGLVILAAAGFLIFNAFAMTVAQRRRQIGILRSLGMTRRQVLRQVQAEALIIGGAGTLLGLFLGPMLGNLTLTAFRQLGVAMGQGSASLGSYLLGTVMGLGITLLSVWIPARQATRVSPLTALREEMATDGSHTSRRLPLIGVMLASFLWIYLALAPPGEWSGHHSPLDFVMFGALTIPWLLAIGLLLPALIGGVGGLIKWLSGHRSGANIRLISENFTRDRHRVTLTILTFAVGLTMINGLNGLLSFSNNVLLVRSAAGSLGQTTWYVYPFDRNSGIAQLDEMNNGAGLSDAVTADFYALAEGRAEVSQNFAVTIPELSAPVPGFFSMMNDLRELNRPGLYNFVEGDWETAVPIMESGCGLLLPPTVANRHKVGVGDTLILPGKDGPVNCTVAGIGSGGNLPISRISLAAKDQFDVGNATALTIWPLPETDETTFRTELEALADKHGDAAWITDTEEELQSIFDTSDQLETMTYAMLTLAVVAAALGMVNTTVMSITERQRELGLLRAVGMTRRQATAIVTSEAALMGLIGGVIGLIAGLGVAFIFGLSFGGISFGLIDLPLWESIWEIAPTVFISGLVGIVISPLVATLATYWPARSVLRGTAIETIETSYRPVRQRELSRWLYRGSIRLRFMGGTAVLMLLVLLGLTATVTRHARNYLEAQTTDSVAALVGWNASLIEIGLPDDAQSLTLDSLQNGRLDPAMLLQFRSLIDDLNRYGLAEFDVTDADNVVLLSFEPNRIGTVLAPMGEENATAVASPTAVVTETDDNVREIIAHAPIRSPDGDRLGDVRLRMEMGEITAFLDDLRNAVLAVGGLLIVAGLCLIWLLSTPLVRVTRRLAAQAQQVRRGQLTPLPPLRRRLNVSLKTRLTLAMAASLALLVFALELVVIPLEQQKVMQVTQDTLIAGAEWAAEMTGAALAEQAVNLSDFGNLDQLLEMMRGFDAGQLQTLSEQMQNEHIAYSAFINEDGVVAFSDQIGLMGTETAVPAQIVLEDATWQEEPIWRVTAPIENDDDQSRSGALQIGVRTAGMTEFIDNSRTIFRFAGLIAILAGVLLAQALGGAIAAPVQQLAADARRVGTGDLSVSFQTRGRDELSQLAAAFNEMVAGLREREWLRDMFGRFVSQEVAEALRTGQVKLEGENRVVSVLFCDIRGFTARSERSSPAEIVALLNAYLPVVVNAAQQHDGTVNKFGGDSTLVIYGAPNRVAESAYQAVQTAVAIQHGLAALNERLAAQGEEPIRIGVGINTGVALAGAVGTPQRQEYTVIGDTVNLASRIEALNKEYPAYGILLSQQTVDALGPRRQEFTLIPLGDVPIRGKQAPVQVWAVGSS